MKECYDTENIILTVGRDGKITDGKELNETVRISCMLGS